MLCGIGFAVISRDRIRADGPLAAPAIWLVALHAGAVVLPVALYFYLVHPAWSWMYSRDPAHGSALWVPLLVVGHGALVFAGWYVAGVLLRRDARRAVVSIGGVLAVLALVFMLAAHRRLATAADYPGFHADRGSGVFQVQLGWAITISLLAIIGSAIYVAVELMRDGRRVRMR